MNAKIGFIGCGNMGGALLRALCRSLRASDVSVFDTSAEKTASLRKELGVTVSESASSLASEVDYLVLGVKPDTLPALLSSLKQTLDQKGSRTVLISMAAGVSIAGIRKVIGEYPVIRIMPNTPASVGEGMILYSAVGTEDADISFFLDAFRCAGRLDALEEKYIDAASALSGCGPAFVCLFTEALSDGAVACGLPRDKAALYAAQTLLGTARLILETGEHPGKLKDAVCSPGGTTIEGVRALEEGALRGTVMDAVLAAYEKTLALGKK